MSWAPHRPGAKGPPAGGGVGQPEGSAAMAQPCSAPECTATSNFACSRCHAVFYCGTPCQKAHWRAHRLGCAAAAPAPTPAPAAAQGGGAGAGAVTGSRGGGGAATLSAGNGGERAGAAAQRCSAPGCAAEGTFACLACRAAFYCGAPCQRAHWRAHKDDCAAMAAAPTAAAHGGAGAGAGSGGGNSAAPTPSPYGKLFLYTGLEQVIEDPRCGKCGKDLSHRGRGCEEQQMACGACRKVPYCDMACLESHYLEHMEECFEVIATRVLAGDVHKDDSSGEYVL